MENLVRIAAFEPRSLVNGPGVRAVLWVQGCRRGCPGCFNSDFQPLEGGRLINFPTIISWINEAKGIEGVTFSGGEPFDQALALSQIVQQVRQMGLGVLVFSGYTFQELKVEKKFFALLRETDLLMAGPYDQNQPSSHPLLGSANQEMIFLTERYQGYHLQPGRRVEFRIAGDGQVRISGLPKRAA